MNILVNCEIFWHPSALWIFAMTANIVNVYFVPDCSPVIVAFGEVLGTHLFAESDDDVE
jgi:hypothetical protein